jgi:hypothetical protein
LKFDPGGHCCEDVTNLGEEIEASEKKLEAEEAEDV